jgi:hypothetical protein
LKNKKCLLGGASTTLTIILGFFPGKLQQRSKKNKSFTAKKVFYFALS